MGCMASTEESYVSYDFRIKGSKKPFRIEGDHSVKEEDSVKLSHYFRERQKIARALRTSSMGRALPECLVEMISVYGSNDFDFVGYCIDQGCFEEGDLTRDELSLSGWKCTPTKMRKIAAVLKYSKVKRLNFVDLHIDDYCLGIMVAALKNCPDVKELVLARNFIGDEGALVLAGLLPRLKLEKLDLSFNSIGDLGAKALGRCLPLCTALKQVNLVGNAISENVKYGLVQIAEAMPPTKLFVLQLRLEPPTPRRVYFMEIRLEDLSESSLISLEEEELSNYDSCEEEGPYIF